MIIIATIGVNSLTDDKIKKILLAGADILRFNFSYRTLEENISNIRRTKSIIYELNSSTKILVDFPIKKIRLGAFDTKIFSVQENDTLTLRSAPYSPDCNQFIPIKTQKLGELVRPNQILTLGDGEVALNINEIIDTETVTALVLNNGVINFGKSFNVNYSQNENQILNTYKPIFECLNEIPADYIAISFINQTFNEEIKKHIIEIAPPSIKVLLKIENGISLPELETICQDKFYQSLIIDRGEIGVNMPYEQLGILQKEICRVAQKNNKKIIVSTQILQSAITNYIPYRSEILDITNMMLDDVYGVMFCHETGFGSRPAYSISVAKKIINEMEKHKKFAANKTGIL